MKKIVINGCFGGFSISKQAKELLSAKGAEWADYRFDEDYRDNPLLIEVVEEIGLRAASGVHAELEIVEIPDDVEWQLEEYDGAEWIAEKHRTWGR